MTKRKEDAPVYVPDGADEVFVVGLGEEDGKMGGRPTGVAVYRGVPIGEVPDGEAMAKGLAMETAIGGRPKGEERAFHRVRAKPSRTIIIGEE